MPELDNRLNDNEIAARVRAEQDDPLAMYLVVREQFAVDAEPGTLVAQAAIATARSVDRFMDDPVYADSFHDWYRGSFRKITLRADEQEWAKLEEEHDVAGTDLVVAVPPRRKSERDRLLKRMQSFKGSDPISGLREFSAAALEQEQAPVIVVVNDEVPMSTGKACAQAGHAVLVLRKLQPAHPLVAAWPELGYRLSVYGAGGRWQEIKERFDCALIRDAGITEVAPRSETVLCFANPR